MTATNELNLLLLNREACLNFQLKDKKSGKLFLEGFLLNSVNPSVALFWLATITIAIKRSEQNTMWIFVFFACIFATVIITDAFKFILASKLSRFLNDKRQHRFSLLTSLILLVFGLYMILSNTIL